MRIRIALNGFEVIASHQSRFFVPSVTTVVYSELHSISSEKTAIQNHIPETEIAIATSVNNVKTVVPKCPISHTTILNPALYNRINLSSIFYGLWLD